MSNLIFKLLFTGSWGLIVLCSQMFTGSMKLKYLDNCFYTVSVVYSIIMDLEGTNKTINIENTFARLGKKTQQFL